MTLDSIARGLSSVRSRRTAGGPWFDMESLVQNMKGPKYKDEMWKGSPDFRDLALLSKSRGRLLEQRTI